jgi:hypothetical protein
MSILEIFRNLPFDLIREILLFDKRFVYRKHNKIFTIIDKIPKQKIVIFSSLFNSISPIINFSSFPKKLSVILFKKNKKFIIQYNLPIHPNEFWEYRFLTFTKDSHTNILNDIPDSIFYYTIK